MGKPMLGMGLFMRTDGHYVRRSSKATTGGLDATDFCNCPAVTNMCAVVFGVRPSLDEIRSGASVVSQSP